MNADGTTSAPVSRPVARAAAKWFILLQSEQANSDDFRACEQWRQQSPEHEQAWQRANRVQQQLSGLPATLAIKTLGRSDRSDRRRAIKSLALLITAAPATYFTARIAPWENWSADYVTGIGEQRQLTLSDGSELHLNTDTRVDVRFDETERRIILHEGEILLNTGADAASPNGTPRRLTVQSQHGQLRPIGTRFIVRQQAQKPTRLSVLEGAVEIQPQQSSSPQILSTGQQADFTHSQIDTVVSLKAQSDAWTRGVLYARNMPLGEFLQELNRYRRGNLRCDPAVADLRITGAFQLSRVEQTLAALPDTLPVEVNALLGYWVTVKARQ